MYPLAAYAALGMTNADSITRAPLTAAMITREATVSLAAFRAAPEPAADTQPRFPFEAGVPAAPRFGVAQFGTAQAIDPAWLRWTLDRFSTEIIHPAMAELAKAIPAGEPLSQEFLDLPVGNVTEAANERHRFAMRGILYETPVRDNVVPWSEVKPYYDIMTDAWITGPVCLVLRFDVIQDHPAGAAQP